MEKKLVIELDTQETIEFLHAKKNLEKKLDIEISDNKAIEFLSKIFNAGGHSNIRVFNIIKSTMKYEPDLCPVCKNEFFPSTKSKKTCSMNCRKILYKRKKYGLSPTMIKEKMS